MRINDLLRKYFVEILVILFGIIFGSFLMFSSFSYGNDSILISSRAWSDFASHIPLIRSFSYGANFPPQYPLFPGEVIKYHFLFYAFVGFLEKIGVRIDFALNIPSIFGFTFLIIMIYLISKMVFKSRTVGLLSVIFFIFNSSLTFIYYFKNNPLSIESILNIPKIKDFQSFAPYGDGIISAFWNLNIYTNQRHLALSFGLSLLIIYFILQNIFKDKNVNYKIYIILGFILGLSFYLHLAVLLMTGIVIFMLAILFKKVRKALIMLLFISAIIALPQYLYLNSSTGFQIILNPGYLIADKLSVFNFTEFWIYNLGLSIFLGILGFIFGNKNQRKFFIIFIPILLVGNLIQFSPEIAANHKFFNYAILFINMFCAFALYILWKKNNILKPFVILFTFLMIIGGVLDFFPIFNDHKISISDLKANPDALWIKNNTPPDSVFLNTSYLYNPASLAGRKIFIGWPYFAWSQGYDTNKRGEIFKTIFASNTKSEACNLLKVNKINYIEIKVQNPKDPDIPPISNIYDLTFNPSYINEEFNYKIFDVSSNCK